MLPIECDPLLVNVQYYAKKDMDEYNQFVKNSPFASRHELWNKLHSGPVEASYQPESDGYVPVSITLGIHWTLFVK